MSNARDKYSDIIDMPHHQSTRRAHMSLHDRAAQFAPFAALSGYDDEISEKGSPVVLMSQLLVMSAG